MRTTTAAPSRYATLIRSVFSLSPIVTHKSRGTDMSEMIPVDFSTLTTIKVSLRRPCTSPSPPTLAKSGSLGSAPARESEPTTRKFANWSFGSANTDVNETSRRTSANESSSARATPMNPAAPNSTTMATATSQFCWRSRLRRAPNSFFIPV